VIADVHVFYDLPIWIVLAFFIIPGNDLKIMQIGLDHIVDLVL
jgi:hypothetical protein